MPDPDTAVHITEMAGRLRSDLHVKARPLHAGRLHISLHHLGEFAYAPEVVVAKACAAATSIDVAPFDVTFDRISSFSTRICRRLCPMYAGAIRRYRIRKFKLQDKMLSHREVIVRST
jgi:2'-5' RNA ligase